MTDELDRLREALRDIPQANSAARQTALDAAMVAFDSHRSQARVAAVRSTAAPRKTGVWQGVRQMISTLVSRPALATTASVAALCLGLVAVLPLMPEDSLSPGLAPKSLPEPLREAAPATPVQRDQPVSELTAAQPPLADAAGPVQPLAGRSAAPSIVAAAPAEAFRSETPAPPLPETEAFANAPSAGPIATAEQPVSTFAADVDTASYAIVRSSLLAGALPPRDAVRIEEMVNYFPYAYPAPGQDGPPFLADVDVIETPWNAETKLVRIGVQGRLPALADRPPLNLVLLVDTSGSMQDANKLPLLKQGLRLMLGQLRPEDRVAIVAYAGSAGEVLPPTAASDRESILSALDRLDAGGPTAGTEGIKLAYQVAEGMAETGRIGRVLLATDGDFNLGIFDPERLEEMIAAKRDSGVYLSVLGFGRGNLDDATMQALAQSGNGTAAYIDTAQEARKVLVDQLSGVLFPIADDLKLQVEWNPATVGEWRLIGYETRALTRADFGNDKVDAGELGAGHSVTALYEVTPPDSPALRNETLRYGQPTPDGPADELGFLRLRWKEPGAAESTQIQLPIPEATGSGTEDTRFAAAIAGFGQLLTGGTYLGNWDWEQAIELAERNRGSDPFGYRAEAVTLLRLAQSLDR